MKAQTYHTAHETFVVKSFAISTCGFKSGALEAYVFKGYYINDFSVIT